VIELPVPVVESVVPGPEVSVRPGLFVLLPFGFAIPINACHTLLYRDC